MLIWQVSFTRLFHARLALCLGTRLKHRKNKSANRTRADDFYLYTIGVARLELYFKNIVDQGQSIKKA